MQIMSDFNVQITMTTSDGLEIFSTEVPLDGQWANNSSAANASLSDDTEDDFYRHSATVATIYCLACKWQQSIQRTLAASYYSNTASNFQNIIEYHLFTDALVFLLGLVGNCLVVAVVFRAPRMRTVTNYFIVIHRQ